MEYLGRDGLAPSWRGGAFRAVDNAPPFPRFLNAPVPHNITEPSDPEAKPVEQAILGELLHCHDELAYTLMLSR